MQNSSDFFILNSNYRLVPQGGKPEKLPSFKVFAWFSILAFTFVFLWFFGFSKITAEIQREIATFRSPHQAQGRVLKKWTEYGDPNLHWVSYEYSTPEGLGRGEDVVGMSKHHELEPGDPVTVRYAGFGEKRYSMLSCHSWWEMGLIVLLTALWVGTIVAACIGHTCMVRRKRLCLREGQLLTGRSTSMEIKVDTDHGPMLTLGYLFTSPQSGREVRGEERLKRKDLVDKVLPEGAQVHVLYVSDKTHLVL